MLTILVTVNFFLIKYGYVSANNIILNICYLHLIYITFHMVKDSNKATRITLESS